jgi:signal transduction histidine kinase/ligand-binding sensor domain-containing protein
MHRLTIFFLVFMIVGCNQPIKDNVSQFDGLQRSNTYPLLNMGGYKIHPLTGDSIKPLINSPGDTVRTGVIVGVTGTPMETERLKLPKTIVAGAPNIVTLDNNVFALGRPGNRYVTVSISSGDFHDSSFMQPGDDSVHKATDLPVFFCVGSSYPGPQPAMPPRYKDNAIFDIQYWDIDQGLSSSYLYDILADSKGNIWFATDVGGATLFDGVTFRHFTEKNGLTHNWVRSIIEDKNGNIWFGTYGGGITRYDGDVFYQHKKSSAERSNFITALLEDSRGNVWFGSNGGGLGIIARGELDKEGLDTFKAFSLVNGLNDDIIHCITEDNSGSIWVGTGRGGATRIDIGNEGSLSSARFTHFDFGNEIYNNVRAIMQDRNGALWFGTLGGGLFRLAHEHTKVIGDVALEHFTTAHGITSDHVSKLLEDRRGDIWVGTTRGGLMQLQLGLQGQKISNPAIVRYTLLEGLTNINIRALTEDKEGNIWVGAGGGGVCRIKTNSFVQTPDNEVLNSHLVRAIVGDQQGNLWFGNGVKGLTLYDGTSYKNFGTRQGLSSNDVRALAIDREGNLWVGTFDRGVNRLNLSYVDGQVGVESITHYTTEEGLSHDIIRSVFSDSKGNIWIGTTGGGVTQLIPASISPSGRDEFIHFTEKEGMTDNVVWMINEDSRGNIWIATNQGVTQYDGNAFMHLTPAEGMPHPIVRSIVEDRNGNMWFGTFGGIALLKGGMFTCYTINEGLSHNYVYSIVVDQLNQLWVATERGLNKIPYYPGHGLADGIHYIPYAFGKLDGMKGVDHHQNSVWIDQNNHAWWGTGKGLQHLNLNNFRVSSQAPIPSLKHLEINEEFVDFRNLMTNPSSDLSFGKVEPFANYPVQPFFTYDQNHLTFHFSAVDWAAPHKIQYSYRILGLTNSWSRPGSESKADYRNIPDGTYTFQVRAIGENRQWSEPISYGFTILPPWWRTWWFYLFVGVVMLLAVLAVFRWRLTQLRIQKKLLKKMVEEKNTELLRQNETLKRLNNEQHILNTELYATNEELASANEDLLNQREELEQTLSSLQKAQNQLIQSEKMASLGILSAGVAHEINNPLNFIQAGIIAIEQFFNENLKDHLHEVKPLIEGIQTGISRTSTIVASLNHYSRQNHEKLTQCNIHQIIDNCLTILQNQTKGKVEICKEYSVDQPIIEGNESKLHQVFLNILANAVQAIEQNGVIVISTLYENKYLKLIFQDSGSGISPEHISRITDPFFTTKEPGKGTGLGLSISLSIIKEHGGNLEFQSVPEEGTSVIITLPLKK